MTADIDALNYPYIHIREVEWLKRTLLIFPHVVRMLPRFREYSDFDLPEIRPFCAAIGRRGPLLRPARVQAIHVEQAQTRLIREIKRDLARDEKGFKAKFGKAAAKRFLARTKAQGFQIHSGKLFEELGRFLTREGLAWEPDKDLSDGWGYLELHPKMGDAVMATLAFACAENEGLQVVTEFPKLHGSIIGLPEKSIYGASLANKISGEKEVGEDAVQFLVYRRCDPSKLSVDRLLALNQEWEALADFRAALQVAAGRVPKNIRDNEIREQYLNDVADDVFKKWENDKANLSNYVRELFGEGMLSQPGRLLEKIAEKAFTPAAAGAGAAIAGSLTTGALTGATAGFAVGLITYAGTTWQKVRGKQRNSPYRYLTMLERQGVSFAVGR